MVRTSVLCQKTNKTSFFARRSNFQIRSLFFSGAQPAHANVLLIQGEMFPQYKETKILIYVFGMFATIPERGNT